MIKEFYKCFFVITFVVITSILFTAVQSYASDEQEWIEQSCPADGDCGSPRAGMRYLAFEKIMEARHELEVFDEMINVCNSSDFNDPIFQGQINRYRADVIDMALQAYYLTGSIDCNCDDTTLMAEIQSATLDFPKYEWPQDLQELVNTGILNHLPQSPYDSSRWLSENPVDGGQPGDVIYFAVPTSNNGYFLAAPGGLENFLFYIIGRPGVFVKDSEYLDRSFLGTLNVLLPVCPDNIVFLVGQLYEEN